MKKTKRFLVGLLCVLSVCAFAGCEEKHVHSYTDEVTAPTCTEKGYTMHTCSCGEKVVDSYVDELGHDFKEYISDNNATYDSDGTKTAICTRENCEEKDTVTEANTKLESKIAFKTLLIDGTNAFVKVSNTTETFSFIDEIASFGAAKFIVALDIYGVQQVITKTLSLDIGDNKAYIIEMIDDEPINVYSVTVRRRPVYEVAFNTNGGSSVQTQMVEEDSFASIPNDVAKLGYRFTSWDYDFNVPITQKTMINAVWEVKEEMQNFNFTSTATTCSITGIKDKTVAEIFVPDYVTSISQGAFSGCSSLESITIPFVGGSRKTPGGTYQYPFGYIFGTINYTGSTATQQEYKISNASSGGEQASIYSSIYYIPASLQRVTITDGNILYGAFSSCENLTSVVIGDSVTYIGDGAFYNCSGLKSITIPDSVTNIGSSAFDGCSSLTSIKIPDSVESIGNYAFRYCSSLTSITIPDNVTNIGSSAFDGCSSLTSITIPDSVTNIGSSAFDGCSSLTSIKIPDSVESIGNYAFRYCSSLTSITIPDNVTNIGSSAFYYCDSLTSITIPDRATLPSLHPQNNYSTL